jgi:hypothetical protein
MVLAIKSNWSVVMNIIKSCLLWTLACSMICAYAQPTKREQVRDDAIQEQLEREQQKKEARKEEEKKAARKQEDQKVADDRARRSLEKRQLQQKINAAQQ